jgi:hypothetical protein
MSSKSSIMALTIIPCFVVYIGFSSRGEGGPGSEHNGLMYSYASSSAHHKAPDLALSYATNVSSRTLWRPCSLSHSNLAFELLPSSAWSSLVMACATAYGTASAGHFMILPSSINHSPIRSIHDRMIDSANFSLCTAIRAGDFGVNAVDTDHLSCPRYVAVFALVTGR